MIPLRTGDLLRNQLTKQIHTLSSAALTQHLLMYIYIQTPTERLNSYSILYAIFYLLFPISHFSYFYNFYASIIRTLTFSIHKLPKLQSSAPEEGPTVRNASCYISIYTYIFLINYLLFIVPFLHFPVLFIYYLSSRSAFSDNCALPTVINKIHQLNYFLFR